MMCKVWIDFTSMKIPRPVVHLCTARLADLGMILSWPGYKIMGCVNFK